MNTLSADTQKFIKLLKHGKTIEEALEEMTYGYRDPDTDVFEVNAYPIVVNFFCDFLDCCDSPNSIFRSLIRYMDYSEFDERMGIEKETTWQEKLTEAMIRTLIMSRVRCDGGYCNGFTEEMENDI